MPILRRETTSFAGEIAVNVLEGSRIIDVKMTLTGLLLDKLFMRRHWLTGY